MKSKDGTNIAWSEIGSGPALILVDGALCHRGFGPMPDVAKLLANDFRVITYDRRGRGESGDTKPYSIDREVEDLAALVELAGGEAMLFGSSSGAMLAARAAAALNVPKLAMFEPPFLVDKKPEPEDFRAQIDRALANDDRGEAVKLFMRTVGVPGFVLAIMSMTPVWKKLKASAHTLPYDFAALGDSQKGAALPSEVTEILRSIKASTVVLVGGKSPPSMQNAVQAAASAIPNATTRTLPGQTHTASAKALAPALRDHFATPGTSRDEGRGSFARTAATT